MKVVGIEREGKDLAVTIETRVGWDVFIGSCTVWHRQHDGARPGVRMEKKLSEIAWKYEYDERKKRPDLLERFARLSEVMNDSGFDVDDFERLSKAMNDSKLRVPRGPSADEVIEEGRKTADGFIKQALARAAQRWRDRS